MTTWMNQYVRVLKLSLWLPVCLSALPAQALTIKFSEAELQAKVTQVMPLVRQHALMTVELTNPVLTLAQDKNEIEIKVNIKLSSAGIESHGYTRLTGSINYKSEDAAFYVDNMQVHEVKINGLPNFLTPKVIKIAEKLVNPVLEKRPVYRLKDDLTQTMVKAVLDSIEVRNKELIATLKMV